MESVQAIKQRFEIIGNDPKLNRAVEKAIQVAMDLLKTQEVKLLPQPQDPVRVKRAED